MIHIGQRAGTVCRDKGLTGMVTIIRRKDHPMTTNQNTIVRICLGCRAVDDLPAEACIV